MGQGSPYGSTTGVQEDGQGAPYGRVTAFIGDSQGAPFGVLTSFIDDQQGSPYGVSDVFKSPGVRGRQIAYRTVDGSTKLISASVTGGELQSSAITAREIAAQAVTDAKLASSSVSSDKIQSLAVTTAKIANESVTEAKIGPASISSSKMAVDAVSTTIIQDASVTPAKLSQAYQPALGTLSKDADTFLEITAVALPSDVEVNDEDAASFPDGSTTGIRVAFEIPANYDPAKTVQVYLRVSPSTAFAGDFDVQTDYRKNGGALVGTSVAPVTPSGTANVQSLLLVRTIAAGSIAAGDGIALLVKRLGGTDTHTGAMQLFRIVLRYGV